MSVQKVPADAIRKMRRFKGIKQLDAASRLSISQQAYSKLERKYQVKLSTIQKIVKAFDYSYEDFEKIVRGKDLI